MIEEADLGFLRDRGLAYELGEVDSLRHLTIKDLPLPRGYDHSHVDLLIRVAPDFPDVKPDMFWVDPVIKKADGSWAPQSEVMQAFEGRTWQRFSRHLAADQWRLGIDDIRTWLAMIEQMLRRDAAR
jgi:hypothetical protein